MDINKVVRNFNAKIRRLEKKGFPSYLLPERESVRKIKKYYPYTSKRELNIKLKELKSFTKRGSERVVRLPESRVTKYQYDLMKKRQRRIKSKIARELQEEKKGLTVFNIHKRMRVKELSTLLNKLKKPFKSREDISKINIEYLKEYSPKRKKVFYDNFFEALFKDARFINYNKDRLQEIKRKLQSYTPEQLIELSSKNTMIQNIFDYYNINDSEGISITFDELYSVLGELDVYLA